MSKDKAIKENPAAAEARGATVASTAWGLLAFVVVALLMCAPWIRDEISKSRFTRSRDIKLSIIAPIVKISEKTCFNVPRKFVEEHAGKWLNDVEPPQTSFNEYGGGDDDM